jgi:hypothetical protein
MLYILDNTIDTGSRQSSVHNTPKIHVIEESSDEEDHPDAQTVIKIRKLA